MSAEDEAHLRVGATDDLSEVIARIDRAIAESEHKFEKLGHTAEKAGEEMSAGMDKGARGTNRARDAAGRFVPAAQAAGNAAATAGAKAATGSVGFNKLATAVNSSTHASNKAAASTALGTVTKKVEKLSKSVGGLKAMTMLLKWGSIVTGGQIVVGMLSSLGAGAVMAIGRLSPMVGVLGALGPAFFLAGAGMALFKISGADVMAILRPLTNDFKAMRMEITQAMVPGLQLFNREIHNGLIPTLRTGLVGMAGAFGTAAAHFGAMVTNARTVSQIGVIFRGLNPLIVLMGGAVGRLFTTFINLTMAALPMFTSMAGGMDRVTTRLDAWSTKMATSGRAQAWMTKAWEQMRSAGVTLGNIFVGLYHLFTIAGVAAREGFGGGLANAAAKFKAWTESGKGAERILKFFQDSIPTLRETGLLFLAIVKGIGGLGGGTKIAPLIAMIRTQMLPAIFALLANMTGPNGLGPALIAVFSAVFQALSKIPLTGLTTILQAVAALALAVSWLVTNIPGLGPLLGIFLSLWVVAGAGLKVAGIGLKAFGWVDKAIKGVGKLSLAQKVFGKVLEWTKPLLTGLGEGILWIGRSIALAFAANPLGVIIIAIIALVGLFIWAYNRFDWFRNGVNAVAQAVWKVFVWLAKAAAAPFIELWDIIKAAYNLIAKGWNLIPNIHVPNWVPSIGGQDFGLPKMPLLAHGGVIEYGMAIVGEQGPEALVKGGSFLGMVGLGGPELRTDLPRGGYVVPSLATLSRTPGLTAGLPGSVAGAVSTALPAYGALLGRPSAAPGAPSVTVNLDTGGADVVVAINDLAAVLMRRPAVPDQDKTDKLLAALRGSDQRAATRERYRY